MAVYRWKRAVAWALALLLGWAVLMRLCARWFYRDPTSYFFDRSRAFDLRYTRFRQEQALQFIDNAVTQGAQKTAERATPQLCVAVASVRRDGVQYFAQTVGSLLQGLDLAERDALHLVLFVAHTNPAVHPDSAKGWIEQVADTLLEYRPGDRQRVRQMERGRQFRDKGRLDYAMLLDACHATGAPYNLVLDDDVIALDGWFHRTLAAMGDAERQTAARGADSFLYVRLFFTESLLGWNNEEVPVYARNIVAIYLLEGSLLGLLRLSRLGRAVTVARAAACFVATAAAIAFVFAAGRSSMFPVPSGVVEMSKYACCAQGLVFPRGRVREVVGWLEGRRVGFADSIIEDYANDRGEVRWTLAPSVLQHVGAKSSKGVGRASGHPKLINFGFEDNDAQTLHWEHADAIEQAGVLLPD